MFHSATPWLEHTRLLCPPLSPGICSNSCPLSQWCCLTISSSATSFSFCLQSSPASGSFPVLCIRWPKYWSISFSNSPSNEDSGLISFRIDWFDLLTVQGVLKSLFQHHNSNYRDQLQMLRSPKSYLQTREAGKPWVQSSPSSRDWESRASGESSGQNPKAEKPRVPESKGRRSWMSELQQRANSLLSNLFILFRSSADRKMPSSTGEGHLLTQTTDSSPSLLDTPPQTHPEKPFSQRPGHPLAQPSWQKVTHHTLTQSFSNHLSILTVPPSPARRLKTGLEHRPYPLGSVHTSEREKQMKKKKKDNQQGPTYSTGNYI